MREVGRMSMMAAMLAIMLSDDPAIADGDITGVCSIQDWTHQHVAKREKLYITGRATCESGEMTVFAYSGPQDLRQFLGADRVKIEGFSFEARIKRVYVEPENLALEYMVLD